ncbi:hypothetical protein MRX96_044061 [Rhipicephalus microplus]
MRFNAYVFRAVSVFDGALRARHRERLVVGSSLLLLPFASARMLHLRHRAFGISALLPSRRGGRVSPVKKSRRRRCRARDPCVAHPSSVRGAASIHGFRLRINTGCKDSVRNCVKFNSEEVEWESWTYSLLRRVLRPRLQFPTRDEEFASTPHRNRVAPIFHSRRQPRFSIEHGTPSTR